LPLFVLGPFLWASYFYYLPTLQRKPTRLMITGALLATHILAGTRSAIGDPAFMRAAEEERSGLVLLGLMLAATMTCLLYFVTRGVKS
jgi:hypothetical protein